MALKWLNRLSSPLQHLFDLIAIKTEMMMMMMWKVWMQCSCFYNMIHQNLPMYRPFLIMLLKLALYAPRNSTLRQKNAQIMLDSQNNATLVSENALFNFKQNAETQASCVYQQLNKVNSVKSFVYKSSDTVKTCPMINS